MALGALRLAGTTIVAPASARQAQQRVIWFDGLGAAYMAGEAGKVAASGDIFEMGHNDFTSIRTTRDERPEHITKFQLLNKWLNFTVDLSGVGCACNLAVYLIAAPAMDMAGRPFAGRGDYYCDANQVGGQWCPEIDIMEANNAAFQATPHKCDAPVGDHHYTNCDRAGCSQNTRELGPTVYGPGSEFIIDTRRPFSVNTFLSAGGPGRTEFVGMHQILAQEGREVVLEHQNCDAAYLDELSSTLREGMSLIFSYWGDTAETMAWMDTPQCGQEVCADTGRRAFISHLATSAPTTTAVLPTATTTTTAAATTATTAAMPILTSTSAMSSTPTASFSATAMMSASLDEINLACNAGLEWMGTPWSLTQMRWCCVNAALFCDALARETGVPSLATEVSGTALSKRTMLRVTHPATSAQQTIATTPAPDTATTTSIATSSATATSTETATAISTSKALVAATTLERSSVWGGSTSMGGFNCLAGFWNWHVAWSDDKLAWCCYHEPKRCPKEPEWASLPSKVEEPRRSSSTAWISEEVGKRTAGSAILLALAAGVCCALSGAALLSIRRVAQASGEAGQASFIALSLLEG